MQFNAPTSQSNHSYYKFHLCSRPDFACSICQRLLPLSTHLNGRTGYMYFQMLARKEHFIYFVFYRCIFQKYFRCGKEQQVCAWKTTLLQIFTSGITSLTPSLYGCHQRHQNPVPLLGKGHCFKLWVKSTSSIMKDINRT